MKYKLTIMPALEVSSKKISFEFETKVEMMTCHSNMADLLLFIQDDVKAMKDYSNVFIREELVDGEWEDIDDWED